MAAERVIFGNLKRFLRDKKNVWPFSSMAKLKDLEEALGKIEGAVAALEYKIEVAKPKHESDEEKSLSSSLKNLINLLHQADDLIDEIQTRSQDKRFHRVGNQNRNGYMEEKLKRNLQRMVNACSRVSGKVSYMFPSFNQLVFLSLLDNRVEKIRQEMDELGTQLLNEFRSEEALEIQFQPPQAYTLTETTVIGRETEKERIIDMLLRQRREDETSVPVITITGSSGIGKSALAQIVYDDEKVESHFDLRIWIQVSNKSADIDEREIIKEIVNSCTKRGSEYKRNSKSASAISLQTQVDQNGMGFGDLLGCRGFDRVANIPSFSDRKNKNDMYERRLRKEIEGKLYLLVLDEAYITHWQRLKDILAAGARGSRILMTVSHVKGDDFAKMEIVESYKLEGLSGNDSWSLFGTFALRQEHPLDHELEQIGREIAGYCKGVPLTVKVAASFLYGKSKQEWLSFKNGLVFPPKNDEEIMKHVLDLSYSDLPARLKACFCYCSLFPEDYRFNKYDLIRLWIAQGYIDLEHNQTLEDAAEKYFVELSRRCFFEDVTMDDSRNDVFCKMHHIVHSLACRQAAGVARTSMTEAGASQDVTCKHVSFDSDQGSLMKTPPSVLQGYNLRTLLSFQESDCDQRIGTWDCNKLISNLRCLRVLDLHDFGIEELPESIGKMIHLRYLDLSKNDDLVTLPKSFTELINLQTLKLNSCTKLKRLPSNFSKLENLKHLEVDECDSLSFMPQGLAKLTQLETLSRFVVGQDISKDHAGVKSLKELNNLRRRLAIEFTGDWTTCIMDVSHAQLQHKSHLAELKISWVQKASNNERKSNLLSEKDKRFSPPKQEKVSYKALLDELKPHSNLKILFIEGYKGDDLPQWAGMNNLVTNLPNLVVITIEGCDKCEHLPPFGELPVLKRLTLRHMTNVRYVQGEKSSPSPTVASPSSTSQTPSPAHPSFQALEELTLHNFYKLEEWWKPALKVKPEEEVQSFPCLRNLKLRNCPNLQSMPLFTQVFELDLINVNQMLLEKCAERASYGTPPCIQRLLIMGCPGLTSLTAARKGLGGLDCLQVLVLEKCYELNSLASDLSYLTSLERLEISRCKNLDLSDMGNEWKTLKHLLHLTLREITKMETLPEGLKHVRSLKSLQISGCPALTELPEWIGNLTSLQHLRIESCQNLKKLPDGLKKVKSLMKVEITECIELLKRCKEPTGEDWQKIKHARVLLYKSWRHGLMQEQVASQNISNGGALTDVKYLIIPVIIVGMMMLQILVILFYCLKTKN